MKKILLIVALLPLFALGQSADQNYILTTTIRDSTGSKPPIKQITYFDGLGRPIEQVGYKQSASGKDIVTTIAYDGLGRQEKEYLPIVFGETLDYHNTTEANVLSYYGDNTNVTEITSHPFSQKLFEASPINRVLGQAAPGEPWSVGSNHEVKFDFQTNDAADAVRLFSVSLQTDYTPSLVDTNSFYPLNKLYKTITKNENWTAGDTNTTQEFKDMQGRVILKRTFGISIVNQVPVNEAHDTYYVYDDYGNLTYVIPPLINTTGTVTENDLDYMGYKYQYDYRNRMIAKKLPGKQWEYIVYNSQDKPIATGPALNPWGDGTVGWLITKYDAFGRVVYTGWKQDTVDSTNRNSFQGQLTGAWAEKRTTSPNSIDNVEISYSNDVYPQTFSLLTVTYYDDYNHAFGPASNTPNRIFDRGIHQNAKGLPTGSWVRVLTAPSETAAEVSDTFYDYKGLVIRTEKYNYLGGYTIVNSKLNFTGKPEFTQSFHKRTANDDEVVVKDMYQYSDQDRLLVHKQKINSLPEQLIAKNTYDELGQLKSKQVGGEDVTTFVGLQKVDYQYNIRGWLKSINTIDNLSEQGSPDDLFAFKINYNELDINPSSAPVDALFNGNIAETFWRTKSDNIVRKYGYQYDGLNRLNKAIYQKPDANYYVTNMYNEEMDYDKNGNIQHLKRNGDLDDPSATEAIQIDDLIYTYDQYKKNQLIEVHDNSNHPKGFQDGYNPNNDSEYSYDDNGNMTSDLNKRIYQIQYNHLNLPTEINFDSGDKITYLYNATGQKVKKTVLQSGTTTDTDYLDGYQYSGGTLNFFPHPEGYVKVTYCEQCVQGHQTQFNYVYNYVDHLGNVRLSYGYDTHDNVLKIMEENHYYPFGLKHTRYNTTKKQYSLDYNPYEGPGSISAKIAVVPGDANILNKYKYNGKEYQDELGLNMYDYGAMLYDPALGRRNNIDPKAETSRRWSPYSYAYNNPIFFVDLDGMSAAPPDEYVFKQDGSFKEKIEKSGEDYIRIDKTSLKIKFADPVNDPKAIDNKEITNLVVVNDKAIDNELFKSGVYDKTNQENKYDYIEKESNQSNEEGQGKMDYVTHNLDLMGQQTGDGKSVIPISSPSTLFVSNTESGLVAHNNYNFGNFLWGAGAKALGFSETVAKAGANWNNFWHDKISKFHLDSKDDQFSISIGFEWKKPKF